MAHFVFKAPSPSTIPSPPALTALIVLSATVVTLVSAWWPWDMAGSEDHDLVAKGGLRSLGSLPWEGKRHTRADSGSSLPSRGHFDTKGLEPVGEV